jgi:hypothetical protein
LSLVLSTCGLLVKHHLQMMEKAVLDSLEFIPLLCLKASKAEDLLGSSSEIVLQ